MLPYLLYVAVVGALVALALAGRRWLGARWNPWVGLAVPALFLGAATFRVSEPRALYNDFHKAYYPGVVAALQGPEAMEDLYDSRDVMINPIVHAYFLPIVLCEEAMAAHLYAAAGIAATLAAAWWLGAMAGEDRWTRAVVVALVVANGPLLYSLREGNSTHFVLLLLVGAIALMRRGHDAAAGVLLGIAASNKLPLLLFGVYYLLRRRWRVVAGFATTGVVLLTASWLLFGLELNWFWYDHCIRPLMRRPIAAYNVQSIDGAFARAFIPGDHLRDWDPVRATPLAKYGARVTRWAMYAALAWILWRRGRPRRREEWEAEFGAVLTLAILTSTVSWSHYLLLLLLPFALYVGGGLPIPRRGGWLAAMGAAAVLLSLPVVMVPPGNAPLDAFMHRVGYSHGVVGAIILFVALLWSLRRDDVAPAPTPTPAPAA